MKFLKNLGIFFAALIILGLLNRWYAGGFAPLDVQEQDMPAYTIAYTWFVGEYGKVWPAMNAVYDILSGAGITSFTGVGIYYDDPAVVSGAKLRSDVGAMMDAKDISKLKKNTAVMTKTVAAGTKIVVEFPLKSNISYMIGPMRVYPVIAKYMEEKGYKAVPMTELYDMTAKKIYYIAEITK